MRNTTIKGCTSCGFNTKAKSKKKCPRCGINLIPWDPSNAPLERQPDWPTKKKRNTESVEQSENYIDYSKCSNRKRNS